MTKPIATPTFLSKAAGTLVVFLALTFFAGLSSAAELKFRALETENLRVVYYDEEHTYVLPHLARCFENSMGFYKDFFEYTPSEEVTILFQDFDDYGYAGTSTIPNNYITLGIEPFEYVYETCPTNERINWVISHELVHVVVSEKATGIDNFFRNIFFGKVAANSEDPVSLVYSYLTNPRRYAPRWYHEGIAVFLETWLAGGIGRAMGGYDEMVFRSMVRDDAYFYDVVGLESEGTTSDFQIGQNSYLYGTRFMNYLAYMYGPEKLIDWVNRSPGSKASFSGQFKKVYDNSLDDEWSRWIEWEHEWQTVSLDSVGKYPITPERPLIDRALGSVSRGFYDAADGKLYTAVNYPGEYAHIAAIDVYDGSIEKICYVQTPALYYVTSMVYDEDAGKLYFTTNNGKHWRDLNSVDVKTGKVTELIRDNRTGDLAFNKKDKSIWGVQHHNGKSSLVRIDTPYDDWDCISEIMVLPYGRDIFDLDISPDGEHLTCSMIEITGRAQLVRLSVADMLVGDTSYEVLHEFEKTAPANFVYTPDGKYIVGTSYLTGVSNVFQWNVEQDTMEAVSNCETGYFRPVPVSEDSLIVFNYTGHGLLPVMIPNETIEDVAPVRYLGNAVVDRHAIVKEWQLGSPRAVNLDSVTTYRGDYNIVRGTRLSSAYPIVEAYKDRASFGMRFNLMDPLGLNSAELRASFTPTYELDEDERLHLTFAYRHWPWTLEATYNRADFYDFFGPTKTSRKGYSVSLEYSNYLIVDKPRSLEYKIKAEHHGNLERSPDYQNVLASYEELTTANAKLDYKRLHKSIGAVDYEKGIKWGLGAYENYVNEEFYTRLRAYLDLGIDLPWDHSSIWLRNATGYSFGERDDSFANFFFGGFGNNYVDYQDIQRYHNYDSFPGVELNAVGGTDFGKTTVEWTIPPLRFKRLGVPFMYCTWARLAFFSTGLVTNYTSDTWRRELLNAGAQIDFRLVMYSGLEATLSVGYAGAVEEDRRPETEFMISLKIL